MKTVAVILVALTALASASPALHGNSDSLGMATRQSCTYNCLCNDDKDPDSELPDPDTAPCCASAGGTLGSGGSVCATLLNL